MKTFILFCSVAIVSVSAITPFRRDFNRYQSHNGRYTPVNSGSNDGRYTPDNSGSYKNNDGKYYSDDSGKYVHSDYKYVHNDEKYKHSADKFGNNGGNFGGNGNNGGFGSGSGNNGRNQGPGQAFGSGQGLGSGSGQALGSGQGLGFGQALSSGNGLGSGHLLSSGQGLGSGNKHGSGILISLIGAPIGTGASGFGVPVPLVQGSAAGKYDNRNYGIIRKVEKVESDGYHYLYETENGILAEEQGKLANRGTDAEAMKAHGFFTYTGPDSIVYTVKYTADENGFIPEAAHLPTPPPIPEAIQRALDYQRSVGTL